MKPKNTNRFTYELIGSNEKELILKSASPAQVYQCEFRMGWSSQSSIIFELTGQMGTSLLSTPP